MTESFESPASTIPPLGQAIDPPGFSGPSASQSVPTERTQKTEDVGTVTQNPAHSTLPIPKTVFSPEFQERFWAKVRRSNGCWEWQGSTHDDGYGRTRVPGTRAQFRAHRVAYFLTYRVDPGDMMVCHRCDNRKCCRPGHLFLGTQLDNMADMRAKGRARSGDQSGAKNGNSKLNEGNVREIVRLIQAGLTNKEIGQRVGIGHSLVSRIRVGRSWREFTEAMGYQPKASKRSPKSGKTKCKLHGGPDAPKTTTTLQGVEGCAS